MKKTILITGVTDGIGLETAKMLLAQGHQVLLHGRSRSKLDEVQKSLAVMSTAGQVEGYLADLSNLADVDALGDAVVEKHDKLDVLINNAGVFKTPETKTPDGLDVRFVVNTIAPYRLTQRLSKLIGSNGRVINLSSAAQAPVNLDALAGKIRLGDMDAYAQSKLAITMWSFALAAKKDFPINIAVNPGSLLGTKMVKEGLGSAGKDIGIGARILCRAALDDDFSSASGQYFDNDTGQFSAPWRNGKCIQLCRRHMQNCVYRCNRKRSLRLDLQSPYSNRTDRHRSPFVNSEIKMSAQFLKYFFTVSEISVWYLSATFKVPTLCQCSVPPR